MPAKRGMHILVAKKMARIAGYRGQHLLIRYPSEPILGLRAAHPVWSVTYPCPECGHLAAHEWDCPTKEQYRESNDPLDDKVARGKTEDAYLYSMIGDDRVHP